MKITIFGTGYVGLVTGTCFAEMGNNVLCVDTDKSKISAIRNGECPIYERGLEELLFRNIDQKRLSFSSSTDIALKHSNIYFIAVGTPQKDDGSANLEYVDLVAQTIGDYIKNESLVINKSTVPVGTAQRVSNIIKNQLIKRQIECDFHIVSNPEFLKEGDALRDFMYPDRIVVGSDSEYARNIMKEIYSDFTKQNDRLIFMGIKEAELTKYAANAMLATKISFINEIASLCDRIGIDIDDVRKGIGSDSRIGYSFIYPGCGFGGSCFPKDVQALINSFKKEDLQPYLLQSVVKRNKIQKKVIINQINDRFGNDLKNLKFAIWGISFKPDTDDIREASSLEIITCLIKLGAKVSVHDPVSIPAAKAYFSKSSFDLSNLQFEENEFKAIKDADALILVTEWKMYRNPNFDKLKTILKQLNIFDGRNQYDPKLLREKGYFYKGIGR